MHSAGYVSFPLPFGRQRELLTSNRGKERAGKGFDNSKGLYKCSTEKGVSEVGVFIRQQSVVTCI